ncbi:MAG: hypothetical protein IJO17_02850, partial [Alistipes sp.]|nr:hypothetical protein [Alistipes sp.]
MRDVAQVRAFHDKTICRQNVLEMVHRVENPAMDSTKTYSHCWVFRDVPYMTHFHGKCRIFT